MATESHNTRHPAGTRHAALIGRLRVAYMTGWHAGMATGAIAGAVVGATLIAVAIVGAVQIGGLR